MSIEKITSKIISDAEDAAKVTLDEAKGLCGEIIAEAEKKAASILENAEKQGLEEKEKLIARRKAVADIDGRKLVLEAKQKLIAESFEKAIDKLCSMEKKSYIEFLAGLAEKTGETEGELILSPEDRKTVGEDFVSYLSDHLAGSSFTLSEETRNIRGGFLLKKGSVYINGTIEALVEEAKENLMSDVASRLFQ